MITTRRSSESVQDIAAPRLHYGSRCICYRECFRTMRIHILQLIALPAVACIPLNAQETHAAVTTRIAGDTPAATEAKPAFVFGGVGYFHRWSQNDQHEFAPEGQEDLEKWSDMIAINTYPSAHDGDALAVPFAIFQQGVRTYNGRVVRTNSVPRTPDRPAEHFIAVVFERPNFIEVAFAHFKMVADVGCLIAYSHRIYGEKVGDQMNAWLKDNGPKMERTLMEWNDIPSPASLRELPRKEARPAKASPSKS